MYRVTYREVSRVPLLNFPDTRFPFAPAHFVSTAFFTVMASFLHLVQPSFARRTCPHLVSVSER